MIPDCPGRFCFHFLPAGTHFVDGVFEKLQEALSAANAVAPRDMCSCSFGRCRRESKDAAHTDWYEPHEPNLEKAGLPRDHFIAQE